MKVVGEKENFMWWFFHHLSEAMIIYFKDIILIMSDSNIWGRKDLFQVIRNTNPCIEDISASCVLPFKCKNGIGTQWEKMDETAHISHEFPVLSSFPYIQKQLFGLSICQNKVYYSSRNGKSKALTAFVSNFKVPDATHFLMGLIQSWTDTTWR